MRVLLDECLPRKLRRELPGHEVRTVVEAGWSGTKNGALLKRAAGEFDVFLTVDSNLRISRTPRRSRSRWSCSGRGATMRTSSVR